MANLDVYKIIQLNTTDSISAISLKWKLGFIVYLLVPEYISTHITRYNEVNEQIFFFIWTSIIPTSIFNLIFVTFSLYLLKNYIETPFISPWPPYVCLALT